MIKLTYSDGRFVVRLLEQRRAVVLEMMQRLPAPACKAQSAELRRLDAVLTHIKAELPQITGPEIVDTVRSF